MVGAVSTASEAALVVTKTSTPSAIPSAAAVGIREAMRSSAAPTAVPPPVLRIRVGQLPAFLHVRLK